LAGIGTYRYFVQKSSATNPIATKAPTIITPGGNKARLTLADGSTIVLDSTSKGVIAQQGVTRVSKTIEGKLEYIAQEKSHQLTNQQFNTITTPNGGQYQVVLPDGSTVWLNAASSIQFPTQFSANERRVVITGEVYFDVKKDATKPFRVKFGNTEVEVLGTSFNIMAYTNEAATQTTLIEGAVKLKNGKENRKLTPGQQGTIQDNGSVTIQSVDTEEVTAWKQGLFYFREADVATVMKQVARWYDIEVQFEKGSSGKAQKQFTGKVARNVKIEELLDMLHYAGVEYRIADRKVTIIN
jgi:transmembrane sensor